VEATVEKFRRLGTSGQAEGKDLHTLELGRISRKVLATLLARLEAIDGELSVRMVKVDRRRPHMGSDIEDASGPKMLQWKKEIVVSLQDLQEMPLLITSIVE
jgi:hypothetical protein